MAKKSIKEKLLLKKNVDVSERRSVDIKLFGIEETSKGKTIEYNKIVLSDKDEKLCFYERYCFKNVFDENGNVIGREIFTPAETKDAIKNVSDKLYPILNLDLEEFIKIIKVMN